MLRKPGDTHLAVVLLSGGMDSCVAVAIARQSCGLALMHVSYGQRTEELGARSVYIGAVQEDSSGYPDCREEYYEAFNRLLRVGTRPETRLEVRTPLIHMSKEEIVREGLRLDAPLHLTWSCYTGQEIACGRCESCRLRLKGFRDAGALDPIPYAP